MKKVMLFVCVLFLLQCNLVSGQVAVNGLPSPFPNIREADVMWSKRVWRAIDLREKMNLPFYYPLERNSKHCSLYDVLLKGVFSGEFQAFDSDEFEAEFANPFSIDQFTKRIVQSDSMDVFDVDVEGKELVSKKWLSDTIDNESVREYWILEEWFFDRQRSVMDFKIIGIAPVRYIEDKEAHQALFWVYYPACRKRLDAFAAINPYNGSEERSFDELFTKRLFGSYIKKEENVYDRNINEYALGIDGLLEGEKIKTDIINYEFDLWHY